MVTGLGRRDRPRLEQAKRFGADLAVDVRIVGALGVDLPAYRAALELLASGRFPFDEPSRRVVGFNGLDELLRSMAGEAEPPPVHGVLEPWLN